MEKFTPTLVQQQWIPRKGFWNRLFKRGDFQEVKSDCTFKREGNIITVSGTIKLKEQL